MGLLLFNSLQEGLGYAILALGVYITFRILDFADLTVDGSLATGGAVAVMLIRGGMDPALAHRGEVESRMTFSTYSDFSKIYHFAGNSQKKYLEYYFMKYEISILKACMRKRAVPF